MEATTGNGLRAQKEGEKQEQTQSQGSSCERPSWRGWEGLLVCCKASRTRWLFLNVKSKGEDEGTEDEMLWACLGRDGG